MIPQLSGVDLETFRKPGGAVTKLNVLEVNDWILASAHVPF